MHNKKNFIKSIILDMVPVLSGLIGKVSLVSSFAIIWASELNINSSHFILQNVRTEIFISSIITLLTSIFFHNIMPAGTLAPLIVYIPIMAHLGIHPFILNIFIGIIGLVCVKTKLLDKIISFSGETTKTCLTLVFGISGVVLAVRNLFAYFVDNYMHLIILLLALSFVYAFLLYRNKTWLIIPIAAVASVIYSRVAGIDLFAASTIDPVILNPYKWWVDLWGMGFTFDALSMLITIPFAMFAVLLITVDTVSIQTVIKSEENDIKENADYKKSFVFVFVRNIIGSIFGGAQTGSLWRSFLIPLYSMKRPLRRASILLGILGFCSSVTVVPIMIFSYPPLVWTVLLFGVFLTFVSKGLINVSKSVNNVKIIIVISTIIGLIINPIISWLFIIVAEKRRRLDNRFKDCR